jgi:alpha-tubulin suppressor-like RCC1 family protein
MRCSVVCVLVAAIACSDQSGPRVHETATVSLVAEDRSTCALTNSGAAYCWGNDSAGQLGIGDIEQLSCGSIGDCTGRGGAPHLSPVAVTGGHRFAAISGGGAFTCAATSEGQPWCWGETLFSALLRDSVPTAVGGAPALTSISAGTFHACGVTSSGAAYCWGQNPLGQLGTDDTVAHGTPVPVTGGLAWSSVSVGFDHTCGITKQGAAYCWGDATFGAIGNGSDTASMQTAPTAVSGGLRFASISAGALYTCAVTTTGAAYCWGYNFIGQLGDGTDSTRDVPVPVAQPSGLVLSKVVVSRANDILGTTCGVASGGAAYCWGSSINGQIGNPAIPSCPVFFGPGHIPCSQVPVAVSGGLTFAALAVGDVHVCGVTIAGAVYCWGGNTFGQLGNGTTNDSPMPQLVTGITAP